MLILKIYFLICLFWSVYTFYKHRVSNLPPLNSWRECRDVAIVNFIVCPYAIYIAYQNNKP